LLRLGKCVIANAPIEGLFANRRRLSITNPALDEYIGDFGVIQASWVDLTIVKFFWFLRLAAQGQLKLQSGLLREFRGSLFGQWALTAVQQILC
jgi:hypothetical protein